jgi:hypothetical protein
VSSNAACLFLDWLDLGSEIRFIVDFFWQKKGGVFYQFKMVRK